MNENIPDIVRGHEVWLEPTHLHFHTGGEAHFKALWGHMMQRDGMGDAANWSAWVSKEQGGEEKAYIGPGDGLFYTVSFPVQEEGIYTLVLKNDAGIFSTLKDGSWVKGSLKEYPEAQVSYRYLQWARTSASVGHHQHGKGMPAVPGGLDIVPGEIRDYSTGQTADFKVYYQGKPLAGATVQATYHLYDGSSYPWSGKTGGDGEFSFTFEQKGHYMFIATHLDTSSNEPGQHQGLKLTATLVVTGVR